MEFIDIYQSEKYREVVPTWHAEDSPWKAQQILRMLKRHHLSPHTVCEVGCGVGGILAQLQQSLDPDCTFQGYEVSPYAVKISKEKENDRLHYQQRDFSEEGNEHFDVLLMIDVMEHVEDYYRFLRNLKPKAEYKLIHLPLELSAVSLLRSQALINVRKTYDIHYFTKDLALASLQDAGYEIVDYFYTQRSIALANNFKKKLMAIPRKISFTLHKDFAARVLGGFSLLVLAK